MGVVPVSHYVVLWEVNGYSVLNPLKHLQLMGIASELTDILLHHHILVEYVIHPTGLRIRLLRMHLFVIVSGVDVDVANFS